MQIKTLNFSDKFFENKNISICLLVSKTSDEPILRQILTDSWRKSCQSLGFDERCVFYQERDDLYTEINKSRLMDSLFSSNLMVEVNLNKNRLDTQTSLALHNWAKEPPIDKRLLINAPSLDSPELKSLWFREIDSNGIIIDTSTMPPWEFEDWGRKQCAKSNIKLNKDAIRIIVDHANGSPNELIQTISRLSMLPQSRKNVDIDSVIASCNALHVYPIRQMLDEALESDLIKLSVSLKATINQQTDILAVLPIIRREISTLLSLKFTSGDSIPSQDHMNFLHVGKKRQDLIRKAIVRLSVNKLRQLMVLAQNADASVKGLHPEPAWLLVRDIVFSIAGSTLRHQL